MFDTLPGSINITVCNGTGVSCENQTATVSSSNPPLSAYPSGLYYYDNFVFDVAKSAPRLFTVQPTVDML